MSKSKTIQRKQQRFVHLCTSMSGKAWIFFTHKGLQKFDTNNKSVALTVLFVSYKNE